VEAEAKLMAERKTAEDARQAQLAVERAQTRAKWEAAAAEAQAKAAAAAARKAERLQQFEEGLVRQLVSIQRPLWVVAEPASLPAASIAVRC
jgi:vacuolar-type H+-ATPase subunit E/Vma4